MLSRIDAWAGWTHGVAASSVATAVVDWARRGTDGMSRVSPTVTSRCAARGDGRREPARMKRRCRRAGGGGDGGGVGGWGGCDDGLACFESSGRYPFSKANFVERRKRVPARRPTAEGCEGQASPQQRNTEYQRRVICHKRHLDNNNHTSKQHRYPRNVKSVCQ